MVARKAQNTPGEAFRISKTSDSLEKHLPHRDLGKKFSERGKDIVRKLQGKFCSNKNWDKQIKAWGISRKILVKVFAKKFELENIE